MGIHDRDWYQDWWAKKHGVTKQADYRQPAKQKARNDWWRAFHRTFYALLFVYFVLSMAKKYLLPLL